MLFMNGMQHYSFRGQANLYRLCGLWQSEDKFGQFFWSKVGSKYLNVKLEVFKEDDNNELRLVSHLTMGEAHFN